MKIYIDREDLINVAGLLKYSKNYYDGHVEAIAIIEKILDENPGINTTTFSVYHSCPICGRTLYLTNPCSNCK